MSSPVVLDYLLDHSFGQLEADHGVRACPAATRTKFSLNYCQISAVPGAAISDECRGLIVRPERALGDAWKDEIVGRCAVVARPFDRFYNHGDPHAASIDIDDPQLRVYEKLDGTLCILYWDDLWQKWCVGTRAVPDADVPMNPDGLTFAELFWQGLGNSFEDRFRPTIVRDFLNSLQRNFSYMFELTSPVNRVVVRYGETTVTLLGARSRDTGNEADLDRLVHGVPRVRSFMVPLTMQELVQKVENLKPDEREGVVLCAPVFDSLGHPISFKRVKLKSPAYVLSHRFKDKLSFARRDVLQSILDGTIDDVLPSLEPSMVAEVDDIRVRVQRFLDGLQSHFDRFKESAQGDRKEFARLVQASGLWYVPFYPMFEKKASSMKEWVMNSAACRKLTRSMLDAMLNCLNSSELVLDS